MLAEDIKNRLKMLKSDLDQVETTQQFSQFRRQPLFNSHWKPAVRLGLRWLERVEACQDHIDEEAAPALQAYLSQLFVIANGHANQSINAVANLRNTFQQNMPLLAFYVLDASGTIDLTQSTIRAWRMEAQEGIEGTAKIAEGELKSTSTALVADIRLSAEEAVRDFEFAKAEASKISVENAQKQFQDAHKRIKHRAVGWGAATGLSLLVLITLLFYLLDNPPPLISAIVASMSPGSKTQMLQVSVPLLIAVSAYYTSIRLAMVGALGITFAFSLRMFRAYLHMLEHNAHKLRVTNSIEAFVAAVRTKEQKDMVLSKLVESVTEFGDTGILGKSGEPNGLPSVIFEAMTKNVGKSE